MLRNIVSAGILGVGVCIPNHVRKNCYWDDVEFGNLPPNNRNIFEGIHERRVFPESMLPSDAEVSAAREAILDADITPHEIDLVMVQSMIQDEILPGNASLVQHKLGLTNAGAWNIDTCCSSFVTMVVTASNLIATQEFKNILVITSAFNSQLSDYSDYLCVNLGDAAGAVVIGKVPEDRGYVGSSCISHGQYHDAFVLSERMPYNTPKKSHFKQSPAKAFLTTHPTKIRDLGKHSVENVTNIIKKVLTKTATTADEIDMFLSHQPIFWAHDAWRESVGIDKSKSYQSYHKYGNLASASIPVNLYEAKKQGMIKDGDNVLIASSGAGENIIAALLKWYDKSLLADYNFDNYKD